MTNLPLLPCLLFPQAIFSAQITERAPATSWLLRPRAASGAARPRGSVPAHECGLAVGASRWRRAVARARRRRCARACRFLAASASRYRRSRSSSRRRASSRVRPCGRGAAAATGCCSTSARRPLLGAEGPAHRGRHVAKGPYHARPSSRRGRALGGIGGASSARELLCDASFWRKKMAQGGEDKATGQISHFLWLFN